MKRCLLLLLSFVVASPAFAQQQLQTESASVRSGPAEASPETKLAQEELKRNQEKARQLLSRTESEARGAEAPMRALLLWQIAEATASFDRAKAIALLQDAFMASTTIDPQETTDRRFLQDHIFDSLLPLDDKAVAELLPQADPASRSRGIGRLVQRDAQKKNYAHALELINEAAADTGPFPYDAVTSLMMALPPDAAAERQNAFMQARNVFERVKDNRLFGNGFDRLIVRFAGVLPKELVLNSVAAVLDRAKASDQETQVSLSSPNGSASFNSAYDYALFELLPVIRRYDPSKADDLIKQNTGLQAVMQQYPNGVQSLDPTIRDTPPKQGERSGLGMSISQSDGKGNSNRSGSGASLGGDPQQQLRSQYAAEAQRIVQDAAKNPRQSIARANALPESLGGSHPRAEALGGIARAVWKTEPAAARDALDEAVKQIASFKAENRTYPLLEAAQAYVSLGEKEAAKKLIDSGFKTAEELYVADHNPDDPNKALKGYWPSTQTWSQFVILEYRLDPDKVPDLISSIKDDEVRASVQIAYASALSGGGLPRSVTTMVSRGKSQSIMSHSSESQ